MVADIRVIERDIGRPEAEQSVLGSLIIDRDTILHVAPVLNAADFADRNHARIYKAILRLYEERVPTDFVTVIDQLERTGELEKVGGVGYLTELIDAVPTAVHAGYYAQIVKDISNRKRLANVAVQIQQSVTDESTSFEETLGNALAEINAVQESGIRRGYRTMDELTDRAFERLEQRNDDALTTGFIDFDRIIGGYRPAQLIVPAARPSMGKSSFQIAAVYQLGVRKQIPVGLISLEMGADELYDRLISLKTGINMNVYRNSHRRSDEDSNRIAAALGVLNDAPVFIDDASDSSLSDVTARARFMHATQGIKALFIDYIQLMGAGRSDNRVQELTIITKGLKRLARQLEIPIIAASQLNRNLEGRNDKTPMLSDLRESGSIEQDADIVAFIHHEYLYSNEAPENRVKVIVAKHRNGPCGEFYSTWIPGQATFRDYSNQ